MTRPKLLDLGCCRGGGATGYDRAGFDVTGVDKESQPLYPFRFVQADMLEVLDSWDLSAFAAIHASPPCQFFTQMNGAHRARHVLGQGRPVVDLLTPTLARLRGLEVPWVVENVVGAGRAVGGWTLKLHGGMFNLKVYRPRVFWSNVLILSPTGPIVRQPVGVWGDRPQVKRRTRLNGDQTGKRSIMWQAQSVEEARAAMEMPWADWHGCKEAIPPAYTEFIGCAVARVCEGPGRVECSISALTVREHRQSLPNLNRQVDMGNATKRRKPRQTALYRVWGDGDLLLYIGISDYFGRRWREHAKDQPWWDEMRRLTADAWHDRREDAEEAEAAAIKAEGPKYNKRHAVALVPQPETRSTGPRLGAAQPFRECHCRDARTGKKLHRNCPRLADKDHGAWYARYTVPKDALGWDPAKSRNQRQIGPFASRRQAAEELAEALHDYARSGFRVAHLPQRRGGRS